MTFCLHPQLKADTLPICPFPLCDVLLMNNALFPWLILVPRVAGAAEITDLAPPQRAALMEEIAQASTALQRLHSPHKINVAALGNQVRQLHVHVIARFTDDAAWPQPVWGKAGEPYPDPSPAIAALAQALARPHAFSP